MYIPPHCMCGNAQLLPLAGPFKTDMYHVRILPILLKCRFPRLDMVFSLINPEETRILHSDKLFRAC